MPSSQKRAASTKENRPSETASKKRKIDSGMQKYYAVRAGHEPGVYLQWSDCQRQINGFKGAQFKSFLTLEDAAAFAAGQEPSSDATSSSKPERYYGVAIGSRPGVYTDWPTAQKAFIGSKGPKYKKFDTRAEAEDFVRTFGNEETRKALGATDEDDEDDKETVVKQEPAKKRAKTSSSSAGANVLKIYTDGSSLGNGKRGATAGVGVYFGPGDPRNISERLAGDVQTNQRAELTAIQRALEVSGDSMDVHIITDSKYAIQCVTEWYANWEKNGWMTRDGQVKNKDLVQAIRRRLTAREMKGTKTEFIWVKGHAADVGNIAADQLAVEGARKMN